MVKRHPKYSMQEFSRRADELYERAVVPSLRPHDHDRFVALDIDSGTFEVDDDDVTATEKLLAKIPEAQIWIARVGHRAAYQLGGHQIKGDE